MASNGGGQVQGKGDDKVREGSELEVNQAYTSHSNL